MRYVPRVVLVALLSAASLSAGRSESRLAEAIQAGDREEVRKLLKDPAEVKATEADGTTPLHWAVRSDDLETSKALLSAGANASAAKIASSSARKRGRAAESENTCSIVRSLTTGMVGSCALTGGSTSSSTAWRAKTR